jgi:hypothetical protein
VKEFHRRCDDQTNILTVILGTNGNIFCGFIPLEWEYHTSNWWMVDNNQKSFLFTLENPHNIPARRFALKITMKHLAIYCCRGYGLCFGGGCYSVIFDNCNTNNNCLTQLEFSDTNDTGLGGNIVSRNMMTFQVKKIEIFEITDQIAFSG